MKILISRCSAYKIATDSGTNAGTKKTDLSAPKAIIELGLKWNLLFSAQSFSDFMIVFVVGAMAWIGSAWSHIVKD